MEPRPSGACPREPRGESERSLTVWCPGGCEALRPVAARQSVCPGHQAAVLRATDDEVGQHGEGHHRCVVGCAGKAKERPLRKYPGGVPGYQNQPLAVPPAPGSLGTFSAP